jgi:hypothetical protein
VASNARQHRTQVASLSPRRTLPPADGVTVQMEEPPTIDYDLQILLHEHGILPKSQQNASLEGDVFWCRKVTTYI